MLRTSKQSGSGISTIYAITLPGHLFVFDTEELPWGVWGTRIV